MSHLSKRLDNVKKRNIIISVIVVIVILVAGYALKSSRAAGFFSAVNLSSTTVSGNATLVGDASLAGGKALQFNAPVTTPPPTPPPTTPPPTTPPPSGTLMGWQLTPDNTGLKPHGLSCDSLPVYTGPTRPAAGTIISQKRIESDIELVKGNIIIEKSCIRPKSGGYGLPFVFGAYLDGSPNRPADGPITVRDSEISGSLLSDKDQAYSDGFKGLANLQRNYIHNVGSGISILLTGNKLDAVVEGNYVHNLRSYGSGANPNDTHSSAFTVRDFDPGAGRMLTVRNNRFSVDGGNESGALYLQTTFGKIGNVTAVGNYLEGGGYLTGAVYHSYDFTGNLRADNNRFRPTGYGPGTVQGGHGAGWAQWTENYRYDASKPDAKGAVVPKP